jgi:hypothetical protein
MVGRGVDGADPVHTSCETVGYIGGEDIVRGNVVESLEEGKGGGVERLGGLERRELLDDDVAMANDNSITVDLLGSSVVVGLGIDEVTCLHVDDLHLNSESLVLHETLVAVLGEHKFAAGGLVETDDATHWGLVT